MPRPIQISDRRAVERHARVHAVFPADGTTPVRALASLRRRGNRSALLESADGPQRLTRWSFVLTDVRASLRPSPGGAVLERDGDREVLPGRVDAALRQAQDRTRLPEPPADAPPLAGGFVGYFAYEFASELEPSVPRPEADPVGAPAFAFERFATTLAFDHALHRLHVVTDAPRGAADYDAAVERIEAAVAAIHAPDPIEGRGFALAAEGLEDRFGADRYCAGVEELQGSIRSGEAFQAVLARRFSARCEGDPLTLYRALRLTNAAPHMYFFETDGATLVGSSPERCLSVSGGLARVTPIAGTRPRGVDEDEDARLGRELRADRKERAEHHMLVDLARNDLGRVARYGTVRVERLGVLERFARVQHLTSDVTCELAPGRDALDTLGAVFPAGTVSGAPKVRAMQLVAAIEGERRGPYGGAFGYLADDGRLDLALTLRTAVVAGGAVHVQAGAGVVHRSDPEAEERETRSKARAVIEAIELAGAGELSAPAVERAEVPA